MPPPGIEPATSWSQSGCSTTEPLCRSKCVSLHFTVQAFHYFNCPNVSHYTSLFKHFIILTVQMCLITLHSSVSLFLLSKCVSLHFTVQVFLYFYCPNVSHYTSLFKLSLFLLSKMCLITLHCSSVSLFFLSKCIPLHFTVQAFLYIYCPNVSHYTSLFKCFITMLFLLSKCVPLYFTVQAFLYFAVQMCLNTFTVQVLFFFLSKCSPLNLTVQEFHHFTVQICHITLLLKCSISFYVHHSFLSE